MAWSLTESAFAGLLQVLDGDSERAGEKYEDLRRTLLRFFQWRGASFAEERVDETLNRLARKIEEGVPLAAYAHVARYAQRIAQNVLLESFKSREQRQRSYDELSREPAVAPEIERNQQAAEKEHYLHCLETSLQRLPAEQSQMIREYYRDDHRDLIVRRRALAERLGLRREALANRAQRLRDKLAEAVERCVRKK